MELFVFKSFASIVADDCGSPRDSIDSGITNFTDDTIAEVNGNRYLDMFHFRKTI